jgi:hypothetical protein
VGSVLVHDARNGSSYKIVGLEKDVQDPSGEIFLYTYLVQHPVTKKWVNPCNVDKDGRKIGIALSGTWDAKATHHQSDTGFSLSCTSGAIAKCVRMGYKPWKTSKDGKSLWSFHQACTRLIRADYCGDGKAHTRNGTHVDVFDLLGIQLDEPREGMKFEAAWNADGATCVNKVRIPEIYSLDKLRKDCPMKASLKKPCQLDEQLKDKQNLLFNRS